MHDGELEGLLASGEVKALLAAPRSGVYVVRSDGTIVWASLSMGEVTGRAPRDLVGDNGWSVFVPPEDLQEVARFRALLSEGDGVVWMRLAMPGGARRWFRVDTLVRGPYLVCAFHPEEDPGRQYHHVQMRPRGEPADHAGH